MTEIEEKRFTLDDMQEFRPTPHLDLPDLHEVACLQPKDGSPYMLFLCEESKPYVGCCPYCSHATVRKSGVLDNDRYVHDVNRGNIRVDILLKCRRYRCENCGATFVHPFESIVEGSQLTKRLLAQIRSESFENTFQSVALRYGYSVPTISNIFESYAAELEAARGPIIAPRVLGIDEKHIVNAARGVFVNGETGVFLEMTPDNKEKTVIKTIRSMVDYDKNIEIITMDMSCGYRAHMEKIFGDAGISKVKIIVDKYHVIQDLGRKVASTKKKLTAYRSDIISRLSNEAKILPESAEMIDAYNSVANDSWLFRFGTEMIKKDEARQIKMAAISKCLPEFNHLRLLKEGLERVYTASDRAEATQFLEEWYGLVPPSRGVHLIEAWEKRYHVNAEMFADFRGLRKAVASWENEILNYFDPGCQFTNAVSEGTNSGIQRINQLGNGYEFKHLRAKALFGHIAIPRTRYYAKEVIKQISVSSYRSDIFNIPTNGVGYINFDHGPKTKEVVAGLLFVSEPDDMFIPPLSAFDDTLLEMIS